MQTVATPPIVELESLLDRFLMRQFVSIAVNTFMELVRQPVFLLLATCSAGFCVFLAAVPYFGFGEDPKLVKDSALAVMFLSGLFGAVVSASATVSREIRQGTALAVLSKPVGRARFLLAKYAGLAGAIALLTYINLIGALLASRMAYDAYGDTDTRTLGIFAGAVLLAYAIAGGSNYFLRRPFVPDALLALTILLTGAVGVVAGFVHSSDLWGGTRLIDWRLLPTAVLILFALWVLAGVALAAATRLEMIPSLALCSALFLLGLMSDYLFGRLAEPVWTGDLRSALLDSRWNEGQQALLRGLLERHDTDRNGQLNGAELESLTTSQVTELRQAGLAGVWWASALYSAVPNWQLFWLADALEGGNRIPWSYVLKSAGYLAGYLGAVLGVALLLFQERELG